MGAGKRVVARGQSGPVGEAFDVSLPNFLGEDFLGEGLYGESL